MQHAGAIISLHYGSLRIERGLVRSADRAQLQSTLGAGERIAGGRETEPAGRKNQIISDALRRSLLGHRNLAAQFATTQHPKAAKLLLVCQFVTETRHEWHGAPTDMSLSTAAGTRTGCPITDEAGQAKQEAFNALGAQLIETLPTDHASLWDTLVALDDTHLDALLAYAVARSVSLSAESKGLTQKYLEAIELNMAEHFTPSVSNYLGRVSKELIIEALKEAKKIKGHADLAALQGLKKGALAAEAESRLTGSGWLPSLLRTAQIKPAKLQKIHKTKRARSVSPSEA